MIARRALFALPSVAAPMALVAVVALGAIGTLGALGATAGAARAQAAAEPTRDSEVDGAPAASEAPRPLTIFFADPETSELPSAATAPAAARPKERSPRERSPLDRAQPGGDSPASRAITAVIGVIAVVVGFFSLRSRTKNCPRCPGRLAPLGPPADAGSEWGERGGPARRALWACRDCGEVGQIEVAGLAYRAGATCPDCARRSALELDTVEPASYLMFGLARIREVCACGRDAEFYRSLPPNEAPPAQLSSGRLRSFRR